MPVAGRSPRQHRQQQSVAVPVRRLSLDPSAGGAAASAQHQEDTALLMRLLEELELEEAQTHAQAQHDAMFERHGEGDVETDALLTADTLLSAAHADVPLEVCTARLAGRGLVGVRTADLQPFDNLVHVEAGENRLSVEAFEPLRRLRVLELPLNGICEVVLSQRAFGCLRVLDLAHNALSPDAVLALGALPALESLDLSYNDLAFLPSLTAQDAEVEVDVETEIAREPVTETDPDPDADTGRRDREREEAGVTKGERDSGGQGSGQDTAHSAAPAQTRSRPTPAASQQPAFLRLRHLILDHNRLEGVSACGALAGLPCLVFLSLNSNRVAYIPHLLQASGTEAVAPFSQLETLSITHNRLRHAEDVLELASWPSLGTVHLEGRFVEVERVGETER